jgi:hypothetical protein
LASRDALKQTTRKTRATNRYSSVGRLSRLATMSAEVRKSRKPTTYTSEVSCSMTIDCVSSTGTMLRTACGSIT